jgi:hypothetical protein
MTNQLTYKGRTIQLDYEPRVGVCNGCRAVIIQLNIVLCVMLEQT